MSARVVVAMSGGVDSAVAAARCVAAGYDVIGISLRLAPDGAGSCCSLDDFHDARAVADRLGFPHYVFDLTDAFARHVMRPFVDEYLRGRTPNPCARCNQHVKFDLLWQRARELGATHLATGHYARVAHDPVTSRATLRMARDAAKDQTYFLFMLGQAELARTLFPVGDATKAEVRAEAAALGLPVADKAESMEVCFVPDGDAARFVERHAAPAALRPGPLVDDDSGEVLGRHEGVHRFTIGQRRGLGIGGGPRRYVRRLDATSGTVGVGSEAGLRGSGLVAREVSWVDGAPSIGATVAVRIRHRHPPLPVRLLREDDGVVAAAFAADGPLVTPGQAAVFYDGERVLGGGWIEGPLRERPPRVHIATLGCKVNAYDTATIADRLRAAGCTVVESGDAADVVIVNSCTVTDVADAESRRLARRARRTQTGARVILTGCYAQTKPHEAAALDAVDHVIGIGRLDALVEAVLSGGGARVTVGNSRREAAVTTFGARTFSGQTRAFLKVQEGCDLFCTFCIVPMARGRSRSLAPRTVLAEIDALAAAGFEEVVLTGVHLGGYGSDLDPAVDLTWLVEAILERGAVPRVRLSSIDPHEVTEPLLRVLAQAPAACPHLHVPLQAADDGVLARMRRRYDGVLAGERLAMIRSMLPEAAIGTDLIAGFPGEDDAAFERTVAFLEASPLTYFHVFPYSVRSGTTAAKLDRQQGPAVVKARARRLRAIGERKRAAFVRRFDGADAEVLVETTRDPQTGRLRGYTRNYLRAALDGPDEWQGRRVPVRLQVGTGGSLDASPRVA